MILLFCMMSQTRRRKFVSKRERERERERETDRQAGRQTDRHTDRQTDKDFGDVRDVT